MVSDKELLEHYKRGWNDELDGKVNIDNQDQSIENLAYQFGIMDAYYGDELRSIDNQTEEQIITKIKEHHGKRQPY